MGNTFTDLGIPFPLFEAPLTDASGYLGLARCCFCTREAVHCFAVGSTDEVVGSCRHCGEHMGLRLRQEKKEVCWSCGQAMQMPVDMERLEELMVCYDCLRAGAVALAKDTAYGVVDWKHARAGLTGGAPGWSRSPGGVELIPLADGKPVAEEAEERPATQQPEGIGAGFVMLPSDERWFAARIAPVHLFELLHTPGYATWQGEQWALCCHQPMIFLGSWRQEDFERSASDGDGRALFEQLLPDIPSFSWEGNALASGEIGVYIFRCSVCAKRAAHWDAS